MHTLLVFRDGKVHRPNDKSAEDFIGADDFGGNSVDQNLSSSTTLTLSSIRSTKSVKRSSVACTSDAILHTMAENMVTSSNGISRHRRQSSGETSSSDISMSSDASSVVTVDSQDSNSSSTQQRFWTVPRVNGGGAGGGGGGHGHGTLPEDMGYRFHLKELDNSSPPNDNDSSLPGLIKYGGKFVPVKAICGETGTVRGVKNRVRAGIDAFQTDKQNRFEKVEEGRVIVYTTSMGVVRGTFQQCLKVKTTLRTLLIAFEERDIFMCKAYQKELADRMSVHDVTVPQVFVDGNLLGDWERIEKLNENGVLRQILRPYKSGSANNPCKKCGGYSLLVCVNCNGSKKSVHRNKFTNSTLPLRCTNCDDNGLVACDFCVHT